MQYNKNDLLIEAETLEETGEYLHIDLIGYSADELRHMAEENKDLIVQYLNENNRLVTKDYITIMDFIDKMESNNIDIPMLDYTNVTAL